MNNAAFEKYSEYNRLLRTWLIAFGAGVPAAILINETMRSSIPSSELKSIILAFIGGSFAQILIAFINKYGNWYEAHPEEKNFIAKLFTKAMKMILIDISIDFISFISFGLAVLWSIQAIFPTPSP